MNKDEKSNFYYLPSVGLLSQVTGQEEMGLKLCREGLDWILGKVASW